MKLLGLLFFTTLISCQSAQKHGSRSLASQGHAKLFSTFIREFKTEAKIVDDVEGKLLAFLKSTNDSAAHADDIGISQTELEKITSLDGDEPYMIQVRAWLTRNMDKVFPSNKAAIKKVYKEVVLKERDLPNVYELSSSANRNIRSHSRKKNPGVQVDNRQKAIMSEIDSLKSAEQKKLLENNLAAGISRADESKRFATLGKDISESGLTIYKKTGLSGIGKGCEEFMKSAPVEAIHNKALIDLSRAQEIEALAYQKNGGKAFRSFDEVPADKRVTQDEIDEITTRAIASVLKKSDDQAASTFKELKSSPCHFF